MATVTRSPKTLIRFWMAPKKTSIKKDLLERGSDRIAVLTGTSSIKLPDKIDYYSQGMTMDDKYTVTPDANGIYFVLY